MSSRSSLGKFIPNWLTSLLLIPDTPAWTRLKYLSTTMPGEPKEKPKIPGFRLGRSRSIGYRLAGSHRLL